MWLMKNKHRSRTVHAHVYCWSAKQLSNDKITCLQSDWSSKNRMLAIWLVNPESKILACWVNKIKKHHSVWQTVHFPHMVAATSAVVGLIGYSSFKPVTQSPLTTNPLGVWHTMSTESTCRWHSAVTWHTYWQTWHVQSSMQAGCVVQCNVLHYWSLLHWRLVHLKPVIILKHLLHQHLKLLRTDRETYSKQATYSRIN